MIEVDERFEVQAPPAVVWKLLADPYAVVGCVPGAAIVGQTDEGGLDTTLTVKFGPISVGFQALAQLSLDADRHQGSISARGKDKQGGARFQSHVTFAVSPHEGGSVVVVDGEVEITGRLASMIEGGAGVVVKRMSAAFAECLQARVSQAV